MGLGGQDLREGFEARLKEIDVEMGRFDKVRARVFKGQSRKGKGGN